MRQILLLGAGRSASYLIKYLLEKSSEENFLLLIADLSLENTLTKAQNHPNAKAFELDIFNNENRRELIRKADLVISMLPAQLHIEVAKDCLHFHKNLITASYVSEQMRQLHDEAVQKNLIFLNEMGLDPGIDHMSAMKMIDQIKSQGGKIISFESYCGGLVAPESDNNPWNYKFSWAPRNVVLAGQGGTAKFLQNGHYKYIPYQRLFSQTSTTNTPFGEFESYANRDSLKYQNVYGLEDAETILRGTLRKPGFSNAWNCLVQLGITDDSFIIENSKTMSYRDFTNSFLSDETKKSIEDELKKQLSINSEDVWNKLISLDLFNPDKIIGLEKATPAQILEKILSEKWALQPEDKDMVVMHHRIIYEIGGKKKQLESSLQCIGESQTLTAMAKTVGLPLAMGALQILKGRYKTSGVQIPIKKEIYEPVLKELENFGIQFIEKEI